MALALGRSSVTSRMPSVALVLDRLPHDTAPFTSRSDESVGRDGALPEGRTIRGLTSSSARRARMRGGEDASGIAAGERGNDITDRRAPDPRRSGTTLSPITATGPPRRSSAASRSRDRRSTSTAHPPAPSKQDGPTAGRGRRRRSARRPGPRIIGSIRIASLICAMRRAAASTPASGSRRSDAHGTKLALVGEFEGPTALITSG